MSDKTINDEIFAQACALNKRAKEQQQLKEDGMKQQQKEVIMNKANRKIAKYVEGKILENLVDAKNTLKFYQESVVETERLQLLYELKETAETLYSLETDLQSAKANNIHSVEAYFS